MMRTMAAVHTYSAGMVLTYEQFKKIQKACLKAGFIQETPDIWDKMEQLYCSVYQEQGIKVYLYGQAGKLYRLRVQVEPCRVLGESDPTALAKLDRRQYRELVKAADKMLKKLKVPCSIDKMKISRCDLTVNIEFSSQEELMEYLRILKKSLRIYPYKHVSFKKDDQKAKDAKTANDHSYCITCKSASFLIYDKIAQLEMIGRCDETLMGKHILRLESELKRPALKKHLGKHSMETNYKLLSSAAQKSIKVIRWYLSRMQPPCEEYLRYEDAVEMVKDSNSKKKIRERMLYLLRKISDSESLTAALEKLRKKYGLSKNQCSNVLRKFEKLGISPITLRNDSDFDMLSAIKA